MHKVRNSSETAVVEPALCPKLGWDVELDAAAIKLGPDSPDSNFEALGDTTNTFVTFDSAVPGRLLNVQVLNVRSNPSWRPVVRSLVGPTLSAELEHLIASDDIVRDRPTTTQVPRGERAALNLTWLTLHGGVRRRLRHPEMARPHLSDSVPEPQWDLLRSTLVVATPATSRERLSGRRDRTFEMPPELAEWLGVDPTLSARQEHGQLSLCLAPASRRRALSVLAVEPALGEQRFCPSASGLEAIFSVEEELTPNGLDDMVLIIRW